jgi:hypothetical protein
MTRMSVAAVAWLAAVGCSLAALFGATAATAVDATNCMQRAVAFDGIKTLRYATVTDVEGATPLLYCEKTSTDPCTTADRIIAGDVVAIGKTCGTWSYVQHIGITSVTVGWLESARLQPSATQLPFDDGEPGARERPDFWQHPYTIRVKLTQGHGVPVCEAYLQRLNQTVFHEPPSCGRPENAQIPGFTRLNRVPLTVGQVNSNYIRVYNLSHPTFYNDNLVEPPADRKDLVAIWMLRGQKGDEVKAITDPADIAAWRFDPPVDIDNDGVPDSVVIWRGYPPLWSLGMPVDACGVLTDSHRPFPHLDQVPLIFTPGYTGIDLAKTIEIFNDPAVHLPQLETDRSRLGTELPYRWIQPRGAVVDVFEYRGKYFSDTTKSDRSNRQIDENQIDVYLNERGTTQKVCEYQNMDREWVPL